MAAGIVSMAHQTSKHPESSVAFDVMSQFSFQVPTSFLPALGLKGWFLGLPISDILLCLVITTIVYHICCKD